MTQLSYPWVSTASDRVIHVDDLTDLTNSQFPTGVFDGLTVTADGGDLSVSAGTACVNGVLYRNTAAVTLTPAASTKSYVVLRLTAANREVVLAMLAGSSSAYPTLTQTAAVYEIALASVDTSVSTTPTDTRYDTTLCGVYAQPGHDTGWTQVVSTSLTLNYRRIGKQVFVRFEVNGGILANSTYTWADVIPAALRPTSFVALSSYGAAYGRSKSAATITGSITVTNHENVTVSYFAGNGTWLID